MIKMVKEGRVREIGMETLEKLDLFAFREFEIVKNGKKKMTNVLIEAFEAGHSELIEYAFSPDSFINVRSLLRASNRYEF